MTSKKQLKARVRSRMATTGERYSAARRHVLQPGAVHSGGPGAPATDPVVDHGWRLTGGTDPDAAALAKILAHRGVEGPHGPISEALTFGIAGGLGAGYILWEFAHDESRHVTLGFSHRCNYLQDRLAPAAERLGLEVEWRRTGGRKAAAGALREELAAGNPVVVWPDRFHVGYWHLPEFDGHGGHPVVVYAEQEERLHLDDRTLAPLTVRADDLDRARARVGSYRNVSFVVRTRDHVVPMASLQTAVQGGLEATVEHLTKTSDSFSLPAWRKWSRTLVDQRGAKAWSRVFADRRGLVGALLSVWEGVEPAGMTGGNLRGLFAATLAESGELLGNPGITAESHRWHDIAEHWHGLAETAAPVDVPALAQARELTAAVTGAVAEGDEGAADRAEAAAALWSLRARYATEPPFDPDRDHAIFTGMSERLVTIFELETAAVHRLAALMR